MSGEQLERSILERKEREELKAIAQAMSLEPVARSKKADLVDQILRAAGVEVAPDADGAATNGKVPAAAKPRATRSRTTKAAKAADEAAGAEDAASAAGAASANGAGAGAAPSGAGTSAEAGTRGETATTTEERTGDPSGSGSASDDSSDDTAAAARSSRQPRGTQRRFSYSASPVDDAPSNGHAAGELDEELAFVSNDSSDSSESAAAARQDAGAESRAAGRETADGSGTGRETSSNGSRSMGGTDSSDSSGSGTSGGGQNGQSAAGHTGTHQQSRQSRQQSQQGQQSQSHQGGGPGNQQGDAGNRRSRRRRGRDRQDREFQGGNQADAPWQGELVPVKGLLDLRDEGYGFLRTTGYLSSSRDVYVSVSQARRFGLRRGDAVEGGCRPAGPSEKYPALLRIDTINQMTPDEARDRRKFEDLTPLFPDARLRLEALTDPLNVTSRIVDLISPIGKGQRSMIVSPPKAGKTTVLKQIAHSIEANDPEVHLMVLLVDERPEEATDWRRSVKGEVIASTFDRPSEEHTQVSELAIERAKRLVELGKDVVIILDGITRLARAYNLAQPATGRIMSGGVDSGALYPPKKFFGAARNIEEGGSLTILATALVETGSKMDEVIFEEFKGTGNMELRLDRKLAERRIYPAIDVNASSTRHEELLFDRSQLQQVWKLRRVLNALGAEGNAAAGLELLMDKIKTTRSNDEFLAEIAKAPSPSN
jgi:transcription termination factor Rho